MIKTGIISAEEISIPLHQNLEKFKELQTIGFLAGYNELTEKMLHFQAEAIIKESQITYFDKTYPSFDLIKYALRNRNNLLFNEIPSLDEDQLKQLIKLSHEADTTIQLSTPLVFNSNNLAEIKKIKAPFLANIRLSSSLDKLNEDNFLQILLLLVLLDNGDFRKADLMTLPDEDGLNILEARLVFRSGSVARILLSKHFAANETGFEVFKIGSKAIHIQANSDSFSQNNETESNAICNLLQTINKQQAVNLSFSHLYQASQIFRNLKQRINYSGGLFSQNRFVG